jgi:quinol monooxygenase YgiN
MFGLVVRLELCEGHKAESDQLVGETVGLIKAQEPGTLAQVALGIEGEPLTRLFYEVYEDEAAFHEHETKAHTIRFLRERSQHLREEPQVWNCLEQRGFVRAGMATTED